MAVAKRGGGGIRLMLDFLMGETEGSIFPIATWRWGHKATA